MKWNEFKTNVLEWADERGILSGSTPFGQLSKTASELSELYESLVKGDVNGVKDGVGDTAVTLVIVAHMWGVDKAIKEPQPGGMLTDLCLAISYRTLADMIEDRLFGNRALRVSVVLNNIATIASTSGLDFMECCEHAWNEISGRKGKMVGGVFVKEG